MKISILTVLFCSTLLFLSCQTEAYKEPFISLDEYQIVDGFDLDVIASEPFIEAPVALDFDDKGRMWVIEMKGYMKNLEDSESQLPNGTISILEDLDGDGLIDHSKVFIDSLVLPRALAHVYGGLLYAEPPNLWFAEIENDQPVNRVLVDSTYSDGGNVEHQPNGLLLNVDNWIYSAKSNFRYQRNNGKWIKEPTSFRGQWGISRDEMGRLYYNNNSVQIIGDYVLPNTSINNPYFKPKSSVNKELTSNQRVYPSHATSVNRGYEPGILDQDSLLINVTSACGPLIYRGNQFNEAYFQNAFVCVPEANIVKRNILTFEPTKTMATQAYNDHEFISSTDEGFRPVNLFNGPDGAMYVVDMHRGIIQDKAFLSPYLHKQLADKKLDTIIGMGRILKVKNSNKKLDQYSNMNSFSLEELSYLLESSNPWIRDKAQQKLIHKKGLSQVANLQKIALNTEKPLAQVHALYTLEGLDALSFDFLITIANLSNPALTAHVLLVMKKQASLENYASFVSLATELLQKNDPMIDLYLTMSLGPWAEYGENNIYSTLKKISERYLDQEIYGEAIISGINGFETQFIDYMNETELTQQKLDSLLNLTVNNIQAEKKNSIYVSTSVGTDSRTAGYQIFSKLCSTCHGHNGDGIEGVGPPLQNSAFVENSEKLALIILHGLKGPIHVNGKLYEFNGTMPGLVSNQEYTDEDIAHIMSYVQNAFIRKGKKFNRSSIKELRDSIPENGSLYTEKELQKFD